jgi:hypothetical protein
MKAIQNYTLTLNFVKKKLTDILKNILIYKAKKIVHILEDGASGVQIGDIEQVTI